MAPITIRVPCSLCGAQILPDTAARNGGVCMPCKGGFRKQIEEGKKQGERDREYEKSPERQYWLSLVERIYETPQGFSGLGQAEKLYFAVLDLEKEVYNGGFDQYFSNSSGEHYYYAIDGLDAMGGKRSAELLVRAKEILFGDMPVSLDRTERFNHMSTLCEGSPSAKKSLYLLDKKFCEDPDNLSEKIKSFAIEYKLYNVFG